MVGCSMANCPTRKQQGVDGEPRPKRVKMGPFKLHRWAKQEPEASLWVLACQSKTPINMKKACICSRHFIRSDYKDQRPTTNQNERWLKDEAVPKQDVDSEAMEEVANLLQLWDKCVEEEKILQQQRGYIFNPSAPRSNSNAQLLSNLQERVDNSPSAPCRRSNNNAQMNLQERVDNSPSAPCRRRSLEDLLTNVNLQEQRGPPAPSRRTNNEIVERIFDEISLQSSNEDNYEYLDDDRDFIGFEKIEGVLQNQIDIIENYGNPNPDNYELLKQIGEALNIYERDPSAYALCLKRQPTLPTVEVLAEWKGKIKLTPGIIQAVLITLKKRNFNNEKCVLMDMIYHIQKHMRMIVKLTQRTIQQTNLSQSLWSNRWQMIGPHIQFIMASISL